MDIVGVATILGTALTAITVIFALTDRHERRRLHQPERPRDWQHLPSSPRLQPSPVFQSPIVLGAEDPLSTGPPIELERFATLWRSLLAYLLGLLGGLVFLFSRRRLVRFHALQSLGIDVATLFYLIFVLFGGAIYSGVRYGSQLTPADDPVLNGSLAGLFAMEFLPRCYCAVQLLRSKTPRIPGIWKLAATLAYRHSM